MQLYVHDLSDLVQMDVDDDGRFPFSPEERYWSEPRFRPFYIRADNRLAGFVVVDSISQLPGEPFEGGPGWDMSQFFVLRRYRRSGVGRAAAVATFERFPGRWEVRQAPANTLLGRRGLRRRDRPPGRTSICSAPRCTTC